jgi:hypothetical protein
MNIKMRLIFAVYLLKIENGCDLEVVMGLQISNFTRSAFVNSESEGEGSGGVASRKTSL